jgi:prepilin-type N-terminal cleavage/methylation domain-containing protein
MEMAKRYSTVKHPIRPGFTLVELLVVITIIGILVSLLTVAAIAALKKGRQTAIKVELDQISAAFEQYKNDVAGSYPPNLQTDGTGTDSFIDDAQVLTDVRRHMSQISSYNSEPDQLVRLMVGDTSAAGGGNTALAGGMTAGEAVVFWLSGFSNDPKYPISGEGGPSYVVEDQSAGINIPAVDRAKADPIENRHWVYPFEVGRLGPRDKDGYFDESDGRFIEYQVTVNGVNQTRRINFWQYTPRNSDQPYLYFDTSRHPAALISGNNVIGPYDPPAATALAGLNPVGSMELHVHPLKKANPAWTTANEDSVPPVIFVNPDKFQILHCGIDGDWGVDFFEQSAVHEIASKDQSKYLLYPDGPFTLESADTIVNFTTGTLEDSQP